MRQRGIELLRYGRKCSEKLRKTQPKSRNQRQPLRKTIQNKICFGLREGPWSAVVEKSRLFTAATIQCSTFLAPSREG